MSDMGMFRQSSSIWSFLRSAAALLGMLYFFVVREFKNLIDLHVVCQEVQDVSGYPLGRKPVSAINLSTPNSQRRQWGVLFLGFLFALSRNRAMALNDYGIVGVYPDATFKILLAR